MAALNTDIKICKSPMSISSVCCGFVTDVSACLDCVITCSISNEDHIQLVIGSY